MATFEEIFGTIRSLLHGHNVVIADALNKHLDRLYTLDAQRCIDEVCPYVQGALELNPKPRIDRTFLVHDPTHWQNHTPSLFNHIVDWPVEKNAFEHCIATCPDHTFEFIIRQIDAEGMKTLLRQPWAMQMKRLRFIKPITQDLLNVIATQTEWPRLDGLTLFESIDLSVLDRLTTLPMFQHVQHVTLSLEQTEDPWTDAHLTCLNRLKHLHTISIDNDSDQDISPAGLAQHPNAHNIQHLSCYNLSDIMTLFRAPMPHLHTLVMTACRLDAESTTHIAQTIEAQKLEALSLMYNHTQRDVFAAIRPLLTPYLKTIHLNNNTLGEATIDALIESGVLKSLTDILIANCSINTKMASCFFEHLSKDYQCLFINDNDIQASALQALANNTEIHSLRQLYLSNNPLKSSIGTMLSRATWLNTLETLCLHNTQLNDPSFGLFLTHPALTQLSYVTLYDNALDDDFCHELTQRTPAWSNIYMNISNNQIGPEGLKHLANWPGLQHINMLDLSNNTFDATSLRALGESPYVATIPYLDLGPLSKAHQQVVQDSKHFNAQTKERVLQYTV